MTHSKDVPSCNPAALGAVLSQLRGKKVLILGDVMLDVYLQGAAERISPEAPVPIVNVAEQKYMPGGAANVARNIRALGGMPTLIGLCGAGRDGQSLIKLLQETYIASHVFQTPHRHTIVKTRIMAQGQQMLRVDKEDCKPPSEEECRELCHALDALIPGHDVIVLSDYAKGLLTPEISQHIQNVCATLHPRPEIFVDPKPRNAACYMHASLMTPNKKEAASLARMDIESREDVIIAGRRIMDAYACPSLLITLGGEGMALFMPDGSVWNIATSTKAVFDVTGAGDTVIATLALARAAGIALMDACFLANYAAGLVLEHVGVAQVTPEELSTAIERYDAPQCVRWE